MNGLVVTGMGAVSPFGKGVRGFVEGLERGDRGTSCHEDDFVDRLDLHQARRLDRLSQILLVAAREAVEDARLAGPVGDGVGVVVGSGLGCLGKTASYLDGIGRAGLAFADPLGFPDSMDSSPTAHIAIALGARGPSMTVSQREISGECAIILAALLLVRGAADAVIVAAGDSVGEATTPLLQRVLRIDRPGEAGAAIVLESAASASSRGAPIRARLLGHAQACEPSDHPSLRPGAAPLLSRAFDSAIAMARGTLADGAEVAAEDPREVPRAMGWCLGDGVLRSVLAIDRLARADRPAVLVGTAARGGAAAALVLGRP